MCTSVSPQKSIRFLFRMVLTIHPVFYACFLFMFVHCTLCFHFSRGTYWLQNFSPEDMQIHQEVQVWFLHFFSFFVLIALQTSLWKFASLFSFWCEDREAEEKWWAKRLDCKVPSVCCIFCLCLISPSLNANLGLYLLIYVCLWIIYLLDIWKMIDLQMKEIVFLIDRMHIDASERHVFSGSKYYIYISFVFILSGIIFSYYASSMNRLKRNWLWQVRKKKQKRKNE